MSFSTFFIK